MARTAKRDALRDAPWTYLGPRRAGANEADAVEGYRYLLHPVSRGIDFHLEGGPEHPMFSHMVSPVRKLGGDNPVAIYHLARMTHTDGAVLTAVQAGMLERRFGLAKRGENP